MSTKKFFLSLGDQIPWLCGDSPKVFNILSEHHWSSAWVFPKVVDSLLRGIAQVCFANNPASGLLILIGLFAGDVRAGAGAVLCSLVAIATAKFIEQNDGAIRSGLTNFSAVLVGTVIASLYPLSFTQPFTWDIWLYMIAAAVFSICVGSGLGVIIGKHNLPGYTLPFNIAASITFICLRARGYADPIVQMISEANVTTEGLTYDVPEAIQWDKVLQGSLLSAGQVYAVESIACSALVLMGLMVCSPILAISSYVGALLATFTALAVSSSPYSLVYAGVWGYNGFLSASCLLFFMVPTTKIIVLAAINAIFTTFLQAAIIPVFSANQLPVFTFPFCISSLLFLALTTDAGLGSERVANPTYPEHHLTLYLERSKTETSKTQRDQPTPDGEHAV